MLPPQAREQLDKSCLYAPSTLCHTPVACHTHFNPVPPSAQAKSALGPARTRPGSRAARISQAGTPRA